MTEVIGARHDFCDSNYSQEWADRFGPTPERERLFSKIIEQLSLADLVYPHILELGVGPGYLAERLLGNISYVSYIGIDFYEPMLQFAAKRLSRHSQRVGFIQADLLDDGWTELVETPIGAIVSTWALHDLGGEDQIVSVYRRAKDLFPEKGLLLNGDFVKPEETRFEYEPGRITVSRHLELLTKTGFSDPKCLLFLEKELEQPTSANNYACLQAIS